jgi:hypothetical protein
MKFHRSHIGRGTYFVGRRYQRGNGFFGNMIKNAIFPLLKYLGAKGIKTAVAIGRAAVDRPNDSISLIARDKLQEAGIEAMEEGVGHVKRLVARSRKRAQGGEGIRRRVKRRKQTKRQPVRKIAKRIVKRKSPSAKRANKRPVVKRKARKRTIAPRSLLFK